MRHLQSEQVMDPKLKRTPCHTPRDRTTVSRNMSNIRSSGSLIERTLGSALWRSGHRYRKQYPIEGKPDFALVRHKIAIFCDSHFWHGYQWESRNAAIKTNRDFWIPKITRQMERDQEVNVSLASSGWIVLRFWEHEIRQDVAACVHWLWLRPRRARRSRRHCPLWRRAIHRWRGVIAGLTPCGLAEARWRCGR